METLTILAESELTSLQNACLAYESGDTVTSVATSEVRAYMRWLAGSQETPPPCDEEIVSAWITQQQAIWALLDKLAEALIALDQDFMNGKTNTIPGWRFEPWAEVLAHPWATDLDRAIADAWEWLAIG